MYPFLYFLYIYTLLLATQVIASTLETAQCPPWIKNSSCHRIFVPLDHANPTTSSRIPILSALFTNPNLKHSNVPIVAIQGGPGSAILTLGNETILLEIVDRIKRPILLVDLRGTGNDSRLSCSANNGSSVLVPNLTFTDRSIGLRDCLIEAGQQIIHYSTNAIVEDLEIIRKAYGFKQYDLYGVSYGTYIQQSYALKYPDSIRSMILDSPLPLDSSPYLPTRAAAYKRIYETQNADDPNFNYTEVLENSATVLQLLRTSKTDIHKEINLTPVDLFSLFALTDENKYPRAIKQAAVDGNFTLLKAMQPLGDEQTPSNIFNILAFASILCNDLVNRVRWAPDAGFGEKLISWFEGLLLNRDPLEFSPFTAIEAQPFPAVCVSFPFPQLQREGTPVQLPSQTDIPTLLLLGDLDQATPIEDIELFDPFLQSKIAIIKGGRHVVVSFGNNCADELVYEFLETGKTSNLSACA